MIVMVSRTGEKTNIQNDTIKKRKLSKSLELDKLSIQEAASYCIEFTGFCLLIIATFDHFVALHISL